MNKISVIIPLFNCEKSIKRAVMSVLHQTYANLELIVVDDGSTDDSFNIVSAIKDKRIILLRNSANKGVSFTRNLALKHVSGDFVCFLDSDDYFSENLFDEVMNIKDLHNSDLVIVGKQMIYEDKTKLCKLPLKQGLYDLKNVIEKDIDSFLDVSIGVWITNKFFKREILRNTLFNVDLTNGEDVDFLTKIYKKVRSFYILENYGTYYDRTHSNSLSRNFKNLFNVYILQIRSHENLIKNLGLKCNSDFYKNYLRFLLYTYTKFDNWNVDDEVKKSVLCSFNRCYNIRREQRCASNQEEIDICNKILEGNK